MAVFIQNLKELNAFFLSILLLLSRLDRFHSLDLSFSPSLSLYHYRFLSNPDFDLKEISIAQVTLSNEIQDRKSVLIVSTDSFLVLLETKIIGYREASLK